ncbi:organic solute transporter subunit beta [Gastrophryne carolinensis]
MAEDQAITAMSEEQKKMQKAIYFFRTGDLTAWNYAILALSFLGLFLGLFLLSKNILNNRKRKMVALYQMKMAAQKADGSDGKQAAVSLEKDGQPQEPGDIRVEWKDGQVTALYTEVPEEDV